MTQRRLSIAMIGTRGVPARYGGFETAIEEIGQRLVDRGHDVTVFCRGGNQSQSHYLGMRLVHLPAVRRKIAETLTHTALSVMHPRARRADVALLFNAANAPLIPALRAARVPVAVHVDGLEWQRSKWSGTGRRYYLLSERLAVRWADALIADAVGIQKYYERTYSAETVFAPYGAPIQTSPSLHRLANIGLSEGGYHLVVARFEPENHVHLALQAYVESQADLPLVVVGTAPYADEYIATLEQIAQRNNGIRMMGPVWDQDLLDALYAGSASYIHGHSVGGTNPSLLRAMGAAAPTLAYDVVFNREVLDQEGRYWAEPDELGALIRDVEQHPTDHRAMGQSARDRAAAEYTWDDVAMRYEGICFELARA